MKTKSIENITADLDALISRYRDSFAEKVYGHENEDHDCMMDLFGITPAVKRENRQYWGRELGMCWQRLVVEVCKHAGRDFGSAIRIGDDEPCDLTLGRLAIDTKYRIGSGDSGTLKKFKAYGPLLRNKGFEPVLMILREDNLGAAISACISGGWRVTTGDETFAFLADQTGID